MAYINLYTERKRNIDGEEKWVCADHFVLNPYYEQDGSQGALYRLLNVQIDPLLVSVLARRMKPKGFPKDANYVARQELEKMGLDAHSHSWITLHSLYKFLTANPSDVMEYFIEKLEKHFGEQMCYIKERDAEKCRIVFWFDN